VTRESQQNKGPQPNGCTAWRALSSDTPQTPTGVRQIANDDSHDARRRTAAIIMEEIG